MKLVHNSVDGINKISTVFNLEENTLFIYDFIGQDRWHEEDTTVTANDFINQLKAVTGDLTVRINSKGGEVGNALAIYQQLLEHPGKVTTVVDGYAYSCAGWIMLAGEERLINEGGLVMVHNPTMYVVVDSEDAVEKVMSQWKAHRDAIVNIINSRTGLDKEKISYMMRETTFMTSDEAITQNFCTGKREKKASITNSIYNTVPDAVKPKIAKPQVEIPNSLLSNSLSAISKFSVK